ncbi:Serine/threonine kinase [Salix suchowensis]|nr:Serine/threonine kinase [Salix suchowensis]
MAINSYNSSSISLCMRILWRLLAERSGVSMRGLPVYLSQEMLREGSDKVYIKVDDGGWDEEKINHRIPHRFEPLTNMVQIGVVIVDICSPRSQKRSKCSECDITCHANCAHLVPDFCGMSMETANELLRNWRDINKQRGGKVHKRTETLPVAQQFSQPEQLNAGIDRLRISGPPDAWAPPQDQREQVATPTDQYNAPGYRPYPQQPPPCPPVSAAAATAW